LGLWCSTSFGLLIAADGYFFCLETKEAKIQVNSRLLLCRTGPSLQSRAAPQAAYLLPLRALWPALLQNLKGLCHRTGSMCRPSFWRSGGG